MVGIVDPPRPEAKAAIAECRDAGIRVRMITGDHASDRRRHRQRAGHRGSGDHRHRVRGDERRGAARPAADIGVIARVAPEDKIRLVQLLKRMGNVVAMTGDGVNDAPALKTADIGVAMGITGTEVSKEAAVMILTDDNFATIVSAVAYGRTLYDNLLKYLRFQMSTLVAYIAVFLAAGVLDIANGTPLNPLQILWLNMVVDIPLAIALGLRPAGTRPDGPAAAPGGRAGPLARELDPPVHPGCGDDGRRAGGLPDRRRPGGRRGRRRRCCSRRCRCSTWSRALLCRDQVNTIFDRDALPAVRSCAATGSRSLAIILVTSIDFLQRIFGTTGLTFAQWCICTGLAATLVVVDELIKLIGRRRHPAPDVVALPVLAPAPAA